MKRNFWGKKSGTFVLGVSLLAITSCREMDSSPPPTKVVADVSNFSEGEDWKVSLSSVNARFGNAMGKSSMKIEGGKLIVEIETSGMKEVAHIQVIRSGTCPVESSDVNTDGFIDGSESGATDANTVLALDGDLLTPEAGSDGYPVSDVSGNYFYSQSADQTVLGGQDLMGKIVLIHGIADSETLPATVHGLGTDDQHETMPVLCGTITKGEIPPQQQQQQVNSSLEAMLE